MALLQITEPGQPPAAQQRKRAAGIDLGTTNSLVAIVRDGEAQTLPDQAGEHLLPSAVRYCVDGTEHVGQAALAAAKDDPRNTLLSVKRLLGRSIEDIKLTGLPLPYEFVKADTSLPLIKVAGKTVSPIETSAAILKVLVQRAIATQAGALDGVVITVPAYFDDAQRQATKDAATLANLPILRLLNEPTAAAVAYGLDTGTEGIIAIYDLGGGTFDISLLRLSRGIFEVLATGGDSALGGDDFDHLLVAYLITQAGAKGQVAAGQYRSLLLVARGLKESLTRVPVVTVDIDIGDLSYTCELSRQQFTDLIQPLLKQTIKICRRAVRDAAVALDDIHSVVLVGGSTRVPAVIDVVTDYFRRQPFNNIDPDRVVALGAAIQANLLVGNRADADMLLLDVLPLSLGIETMGGLTEKIIHRNTVIPVSRAQEFTTYKDGQTGMLIHVVQGEREMVLDCRSLARFELHDIPPLVAGAAKIAVVFQVDADGLLSVSATELSTGVATQVTVKPSYGLSEQEVIHMLQASFAHAEADVQARALSEAKVEADRVVSAVRQALQLDAKRLLAPEEIADIEQKLAQVTAALAEADSHLIAKLTSALIKVTDEFAARRMDASVKSALTGRTLAEIEEKS